jgi:hypothetical protein
MEVIEVKKTYTSPELVVRGTIEEITQGDGLGIADFFVFGIANPIGDCSDNSCGS